MQHSVLTAPDRALTKARASARAACAAAALGLTILWAVGFSPLEILHNTAHDTRHSLVFPCH